MPNAAWHPKENLCEIHRPLATRVVNPYESGLYGPCPTMPAQGLSTCDKWVMTPLGTRLSNATEKSKRLKRFLFDTVAFVVYVLGRSNTT